MNRKILVLLLVALLPKLQYGQDGQLDSTFAVDGVLVLNNSALITNLRGLVVDADGKYLAVGNQGDAGADHFLARINVQGNMDADFGMNGTVLEATSTGLNYANDVLVLPDGKIVTVGTSDSALCVLRFLSNGSLDPTFGYGGKTLVYGATGMAEGMKIVRRPTGELLAGGMLANDQCLVQLLPDGSLDQTFGNGGVALINAPGEMDRIEGLAIRPNGKVITVGRSGNWLFSEVVVAQFTTSGTLDNGFASAGQLVLDLSPYDDRAADVLLLANGDAVFCGSSVFQGYIARITATGELDPGFGSSGISIITLGADSLVPLTALAMQPDGKFVCSGSLSLAGLGQLAVARFSADGALDPTFGSNGISIVDLPTPNGETANDIAVTPNGSILICGYGDAVGSINGIFARFKSGLETGIHELSAVQIDMQIYPVPTDGPVTLVLGFPMPMRFHVDILDTQGRIVKSSILGSTMAHGQQEYLLDLSFLGNGMYRVRCCSKLGCVSRPVVIANDL